MAGAPSLLVRLVVAAVCCTVLSSCVAATSKGNTGFRCMRPFDALSSFTPKHMKHRDNCVFDYLRIDAARVDVLCGASVPPGMGRDACYASVRLNATVLRRLGDDAEPRYTVELRSLNNSRVNYKGMDGNGYSICCAMADGAPCEWRRVEGGDESSSSGPRTQHVPVRCPLLAPNLAEKEAPSAAAKPSPLNGTVTKPLHRLLLGAWDAKVTFLRGPGRVVGQLVVPFSLTREHLTLVLDAVGSEASSSGAWPADAADAGESRDSRSALAVVSSLKANVTGDADPAGGAQ